MSDGTHRLTQETSRHPVTVLDARLEAANSSTKTFKVTPRPCELARNDNAGTTEDHLGRIGA